MLIVYSTEIKNFEYKRHNIVSGAYVKWWIYDNYGEDDTDIRAMTKEEGEVFIQYLLNHRNNFPEGGKQYEQQEAFEVPEFNEYDLLPDDRNAPPEFIVLRPNPKLETQHCKVMDIKLDPMHDYQLPFNVIGQVLRYT